MSLGYFDWMEVCGHYFVWLGVNGALFWVSRDERWWVHCLIMPFLENVYNTCSGHKCHCIVSFHGKSGKMF